jgi:hypothetical protein
MSLVRRIAPNQQAIPAVEYLMSDAKGDVGERHQRRAADRAAGPLQELAVGRRTSTSPAAKRRISQRSWPT